MTSRASLKARRNRQASWSNIETNRMIKDEEANQDLAKPRIPAELQEFLKEISFPQETDEELTEKAAQHPKPKIRGVKPRVDTGSFKGRRKHRPGSSHLASEDGIYSDEPKSPTTRSAQDDDKSLTDVDLSDGTSESGGDVPVPHPVRVKRGDGRLSEYEMAVLWSQFKDKFQDDRMNSVQLSQMLRQVFPRCEPECLEEVVENIMTIFDPHKVGSVSYRDLLIAFSLNMKGPMKDRLKWSFRLYDVEDEGRVDKDDFVKTIIRLCEITKNARLFWQKGASKNRSRLSKTQQKLEDGHEGQRGRPADNCEGQEGHASDSKPSTPSRSIDKERRTSSNSRAIEEETELGKQVKILSSKMSERIGPNKKRIQNERRRKSLENPKELEKALEANLDELDENATRALTELDNEEKLRVKQLGDYLDANSDGFISLDEFVQGCLDDEDFFGIASSFHGELIWGNLF